jgi:hypothetical protein
MSVQRGAWFCLLAIATGAIAACRPRDMSAAPDDGGARMVDAGGKHDAGSASSNEPRGTGGAGDMMAPAVDAGSLPPFTLPESLCSLKVGAECDGSEDCPHGQVCCGQFDTTFITYRQIRCETQCGEPNVEFCHPGDTCQDGSNCTHSVIVPFDFVAVCKTQEQPGSLTGTRVAGEIACGDTTCDSHSEQCCLRARVNLVPALPVGLTPYCAPRGTDCDCEDDTKGQPRDAGDDNDGG